MGLKILQLLAFQFVFIGLYRVWLQRETFYTLNRLYLIGTFLLSILLVTFSFDLVFPITELKTQLLPEVLLQNQVIKLPEVILNKPTNSLHPLLILYALGVGVSLLLFFRKLYTLRGLIVSNKKTDYQSYTLVELVGSRKVFSFYKYVFIGTEVAESHYQTLIKHELVHVTQRHSFDLIFFELAKIIFWFNPLVYLYQKQALALHEFIADAESIKKIDNNTYYNHLLNDLFQVENIAFVNQFYHQSLLKKRLIMMTKNKSEKWKSIKYAFVFPIILAMLFVAQDLKAQDKASQEPLRIQKVDTPPIFPGCESEPKQNLHTCFSKRIVSFVSRKFDTSITDNLGLASGKQRIFVQFIVDENGKVTDVHAKANHEALEQEAIRVTHLLPKMIPAMNEGKNVSIFYTLPIVFMVVGDESNDTDKTASFQSIETPPVFPGCENKNKEEQKKCFSQKTMMFVAKEFNTDLANSLGLAAGKKRIVVQYVIDKSGGVKDVKAKAPHPKLEAEAIRVVKSLPKVTPGKIKANPVDVTFYLPIVFEVVGDSKEKK